MSHSTQLDNFKRLNPPIIGPVLEVGSRCFNETIPTFRSYLRDYKYYGIDVEGGDGVDQIVDICAEYCPLPSDSYGLIICTSALEHMPKPWVAAEHMQRLLRPDGYIYLSVPWVWRYHAYPNDYFRFSVSGVKVLFPRIEWLDFAYATVETNQVIPVTENSLAKTENELRKAKRLPYISVEALGRKL